MLIYCIYFLSANSGELCHALPLFLRMMIADCHHRAGLRSWVGIAVHWLRRKLKLLRSNATDGLVRVEQNGTHSKTQLHPILFSQIFRSLPIFSWYSQVCLKSGGRKNMLVYGLPFGAGKAACMDITLWNGVVSMLPCSLEICLPLPLKKIWPLVALVSFYTKSLGKPWSNSGGLHAFLWEVCAHRHLLQVAASVVPADEEANGTVVGHVIMLPVRVPPRLDWDPDIWGWRPFPLCKATTLLYWHAPFSWDLPITGNMFYPLAIVANKLIIETSRWPASQSHPCPAICFTVQALRSVGAPSAM